MAKAARDGVDLLLLNASNFPGRPIYPYAFVQVTAVARRHGLRTARLDLFKFPRKRWPDVLQAAVAHARPRTVGLHVRQTDSMNEADYLHGKDGFHPLRDTQRVADLVRPLTDAPLVVGGFGFTVRPASTLEAIGADVGVVGDPDDFFAHFETFARGEPLVGVKNVVTRAGGAAPVVSARASYAPNDEPEYTEELIDDLEHFYGKEWLASPRAPTVAVEVSRGCPYACFFCVEPLVKGRTLRKRNLDAAFADVESLARRGHRKIWFICSEVNIGGSALLMELAERMRKLRERTPGPPLHWTCYMLPHVSKEELREVVASGWFLGGFNDVVSLVDADLRRAKVPYAARHAVSFLRNVADLATESPAVPDDFPRDRRRHLGLFLAHPEQSAASLVATLASLDEAGVLPGATREPLVDEAFVIRALRVWDEPLGGREIPAPRFETPRAFVEAFPRAGGLDRFTAYLQRVVLSTQYRRSRDDGAFLKARARRLAALLAGEPAATQALRGLGDGAAARTAMTNVMDGVQRLAGPLWRELGVATTPEGRPDLSDYGVLRVLATRVETLRGLASALRKHLPAADARLVAITLTFEYGIVWDHAIFAFLTGTPA